MTAGALLALRRCVNRVGWKRQWGDDQSTADDDVRVASEALDALGAPEITDELTTVLAKDYVPASGALSGHTNRDQFNAGNLCPKCGFAEVTTRYHRSGGVDCGFGDTCRAHDAPEHLSRRCVRCGYQWAESSLPLEAAER